jgi:dTMP kinase
MGLFITLEGIEGCGKSTHSGIIAGRLREEGHEVLLTHEPGSTGIGAILRKALKQRSATESVCPEAELLLFAASRAQLVKQAILPALRRGRIVVSDRYMDSTTAYQGYGRGLDLERVAEINRFAVGEATPDVTIVLDIGVTEGRERLASRAETSGVGLDRIELEPIEFHERVRQGYLQLAARDPERIKVVGASAPLDVVSERIWEIVRNVVARAASKSC